VSRSWLSDFHFGFALSSLGFCRRPDLVFILLRCSCSRFHESVFCPGSAGPVAAAVSSALVFCPAALMPVSLASCAWLLCLRLLLASRTRRLNDFCFVFIGQGTGPGLPADFSCTSRPPVPGPSQVSSGQPDPVDFPRGESPVSEHCSGLAAILLS
jgi:hypothetical protein